MIMSPRWTCSSTAAAVLATMLWSGAAHAQTDPALEAEKLKTALAEQRRAHAEAQAVIAETEADLAQATATEKAELAKAPADAAEAKSDYDQSITPKLDDQKIGVDRRRTCGGCTVILRTWDGAWPRRR